MARQDINTEFNTFVGGILTEANPINYPQGFTLDEENFILERNGTRRRRRGFDIADTTNTTIRPFIEAATVSNTVGTHLWKNTNRQDGTNKSVDVLVTWKDSLLNFFEVLNKDKPLDDHITSHTVDGKITAVTTHKRQLIVAYSTVSTTVTSTQSTIGTVETPAIKVFNITSSGLDIQVSDSTGRARDFIGKFNSANPDLTDRPGTLQTDERYTRYNQGWGETNLAQFKTDTSTFPSLADNMNTGLDADTGVFTSSWVSLANAGQSLSPLGRFPLDPWAGDHYRHQFLEDTLGSTASFTKDDVRKGCIQDMASFAGRVFFLCSSDSSEFGETFLSFSPATNNVFKYTQWHQANDPTARDLSVLLDTDGGLLDISEVGSPIRMVAFKTRLIIFATRGTFEVFSRDEVIRPADLSLRKITDTVISHVVSEITDAATFIYNRGHSPVVVEETVYYWAPGGVYMLSQDQSSGQTVSLNITDRSIQSLIQGILDSKKAYAQGLYVASDTTIRWLYSDTTSDIRSTPFLKDSELVYDITLKAWYKNKFFNTTNFTPYSAHLMSNLDTQQSTYPVDDNLFYTVDADHGGAQVNAPYSASFKDTNFEDGASITLVSGVDAPAFMQTGFINAGDSARRKQANYIVPSFIRTEDGFTDDGGGNLTPTNESSCTIRADWDYSDTDGGNLFGAPFEAYRYNRLYIPSGAADTFDYGQSVITTKNKLLGRGRALSLRFSTSAGKDCRLLGWNLGFESDTLV